MTTGTVKTQGTELYVIDSSTTDNNMLKMTCPTGINGLGGPADQIEDTCLDATTDKTYQPGLGTPGQVSVPFNLVTKNPLSVHQELFAMKDSKLVFDWLICLSESSEQPTLDTDLFAFIKPTTRSTIEFHGFISDLNLDITGNEVVKGTMTIQRSGSVIPVFLAS